MAIFTFSWAHILKKAICWDVTSFKIRQTFFSHVYVAMRGSPLDDKRLGEAQMETMWRLSCFFSSSSDSVSHCIVSVHWVKCDSTWFGMWCLHRVLDFLLEVCLSLTEKAPYFASGTNFVKWSRWTRIQFEMWWIGATGNFFGFSLTAAAHLYPKLLAPHLRRLPT